MRDRTRDLEQIQEREAEDGPRRAGVILVATLAVVALTFAVGMVVGRAEEPPGAGLTDDPLDRLTDPTPGGKAQAVSANGGVEATELTFPEALTGEEDRPEVLAALRAAAAEEESLDGDGAGPGTDGTTLPAGTAAATRRDAPATPLGADPLAPNANGDRGAEVPAGEPGEFMLQVLSHDNAESAQKFARELRGHGHGAFVAVADVPGRGRTWRVRIGPFATMRQAEAYRRAFEDAEAMNSFVVRRRDEE